MARESLKYWAAAREARRLWVVAFCSVNGCAAEAESLIDAVEPATALERRARSARTLEQHRQHDREALAERAIRHCRLRRDRSHRPPTAGRAGRAAARGVRQARSHDSDRTGRDEESHGFPADGFTGNRSSGDARRDAQAGDCGRPRGWRGGGGGIAPPRRQSSRPVCGAHGLVQALWRFSGHGRSHAEPTRSLWLRCAGSAVVRCRHVQIRLDWAANLS